MIDRRLQVFHAVAELRSFTRAGQRLHMTQPAVTFQIRQLEEHFNTRLFNREHNRIELTEAGRRLDEYAKRILALYAEMDGSLREFSTGIAGTLLLGASMTIAEYDLPRLLVRFKRQFDAVDIKLSVSNTDGVVQMVVENRIDLGLVEGPVHNRSLTVKHYDIDRLVVVLPPDHRLATRKKIPFKSLQDVPLILREEGSGTREVFLEHAKQAGFELEDFNIAMELGSPEAIKSAVGAGLGVGVISMAALRNEIRLQSLLAIPLDPPIERPFSIVHRKQKFRVPAVEELLSFATEKGDD
ncbi:LysR family transcriptional regulator [Thioalkalivibrio sp. HK1]|uniref:LysR family transcriptional regulator n=1 Tax=Thioalkalivibrio sp. HK1 TaxID=1469245 RepID=UPI00046FB761|nr:LysR family transcriptional regulator [Thioalkalivibrio sp. HK1]